MNLIDSNVKPLLRPVMPELNSIRGLACLAVLFFHGFWWYTPATATGAEAMLRNWTSVGFRGVNLFFVLSGLLITNILLNSRDSADYFLRFYKRRALRILPAYYLMLILLVIYGVKSRAFLVVSLFHAANMAPALGIGMAYGPLWSLGVEEQFYLIWPLLVRKLSTRILAVVACGFFLDSALLAIRLSDPSPQATMPIWYSAHGLALGALLAMFFRVPYVKRFHAVVLSAVLTGAGMMLLWLSGQHWARPQASGILSGVSWDILFGALLIVALLIGSSRFEAWTRPRPLLFFGEISYGLYLVHMLVFMTYRRVLHPSDGLAPILVQFTICTTIAIGLATLSRFTVEEYFLRMKDHRMVWLGGVDPGLRAPEKARA